LDIGGDALSNSEGRSGCANTKPPPVTVTANPPSFDLDAGLILEITGGSNV
jgi:hypothetical protein